jgi:hypothetical protein
LEQLRPTVAEVVPVRRPRRIFTAPFILFFGFAILIYRRLGPLTLALALAPQEHTVYRFVQERITMG